MERHIIELVSENWKFALGRQNTVRRGTKWGVVNPGDELVFVCPDEAGKCATALVTAVMKGTFEDLSARGFLFNNHAYGDTADLLKALISVYREFTAEDIVTVLEFELL
jgi:hypothetical protein